MILPHTAWRQYGDTGVIAGAITYLLTVPLIRAYHKRREKKMADRIAALKALKAQAGAVADQRP